MIDPFFGTALGVASSLLGSLFSKKSSDKQLQMQVQENQKNRDFNAEQADIQRQFITKQISDQNAYNSPSAVVERLKSAGLNPNLAYQSIGAGQQISNYQGSAASSNGSVGAGLPDFSGFNSLMQAAQIQSNIKLQESQANKNDADAENTREDTATKKINNNFLPQILEGQINLQGSQIELNTSQLNLNSAEIRKIEATINNLNTNIEEMRSQINLNNINAEQISKSMPDILRELKARANLTERQAEYYVAGFLSQIGLQSSLTSLHYSEAELNRINAQFLPVLLFQQLREINNRIKVGNSEAELNNARARGEIISTNINQGRNRVFESINADDSWYNRYIVDPILGVLSYLPFVK